MAETLRLDKFLWFARIVKTRSAAQLLAEQGRLRLSGRAIDRAHVPVRIGDVLTVPVHGQVRVLRVEALPTRRGPPAEARMLYADLGDTLRSNPAEPAGGCAALTSRGSAD